MAGATEPEAAVTCPLASPLDPFAATATAAGLAAGGTAAAASAGGVVGLGTYEPA